LVKCNNVELYSPSRGFSRIEEGRLSHSTEASLKGFSSQLGTNVTAKKSTRRMGKTLVWKKEERNQQPSKKDRKRRRKKRVRGRAFRKGQSFRALQYAYMRGRKGFPYLGAN